MIIMISLVNIYHHMQLQKHFSYDENFEETGSSLFK